jgi:hypothetical protein
MADNTSVWTFEQLGGERKTLVLSDHAAPHGRPRQKPVVETELEQRNDKVYYAGNSVPTRHLFGVSESNQKLVGRFSDAFGGLGFARRKRLEVEGFWRDAQSCTATWDDLVSVSCFIERVKFGLESGGEITWEMELMIDQSDLVDIPGQVKITGILGPQDITRQINQAITDMHKLVKVPGMRGSVFDSISSLISNVAAVTSALNQVAGQIDSFANAPFQLLNQLRAALDQFRTAVTALRTTYDDLTVHLALENDNAQSWQQFFDVQSAWAASSLEAIRLALAAERASALAQQGNIKELYTAKDGDTWDQISRIAYGGSADRAEDIRKANSVEAGANPVPGTTYMVPT